MHDIGTLPEAAGRGEACLRPAGCGLSVGDHKDRPYTVCQSSAAGFRTFRYSFSFVPAELGLNRFVVAGESKSRLNEVVSCDFGVGFARRLPKTLKKASGRGELAIRGDLLRSCCGFWFLSFHCYGLEVGSGHDELLIPMAELKRHVVIKPITMAAVASLKPPRLAQEFCGAVCPVPQGVYGVSSRPCFLQKLQQTPQPRSAGLA